MLEIKNFQRYCHSWSKHVVKLAESRKTGSKPSIPARIVSSVGRTPNTSYASYPRNVVTISAAGEKTLIRLGSTKGWCHHPRNAKLCSEAIARAGAD